MCLNGIVYCCWWNKRTLQYCHRAESVDVLVEQAYELGRREEQVGLCCWIEFLKIIASVVQRCNKIPEAKSDFAIWFTIQRYSLRICWAYSWERTVE